MSTTITAHRLRQGPLELRFTPPLEITLTDDAGAVIADCTNAPLRAHGDDDSAAVIAVGRQALSLLRGGDATLGAVHAQLTDRRTLSDHDLLAEAETARRAIDAWAATLPHVTAWHHASTALLRGRDGARDLHLELDLTVAAHAPQGAHTAWTESQMELEDALGLIVTVHVLRERALETA